MNKKRKKLRSVKHIALSATFAERAKKEKRKKLRRVKYIARLAI